MEREFLLRVVAYRSAECDPREGRQKQPSIDSYYGRRRRQTCRKAVGPSYDDGSIASQPGAGTEIGNQFAPCDVALLARFPVH